VPAVGLAADPAKLIVAPTASHVIASAVFRDRRLAFGAVGHEKVACDRAVKLINDTLAIVIGSAALEARVFVALGATCAPLATTASTAD